MTRLTYSLRLIVVAGLLSVPACGSKSNSQGKGGSGGGGTGGASGASAGGASGAGGGAGTGGASGAGGGPNCPSPRPSIGAACSFQYYCPYVDVCRCGSCCTAVLGCTNGAVVEIETSGTCSGACDGGAGGGGGGTAISSCPASRPSPGTACTGSFTCNYDDLCRCGVCCYTSYHCMDGSIVYWGSSDGCYNVFPCDAGTTSGTGGTGGSATCTFGADQTCNDNPILSSIRGHCTDAGVCECDGNAGTNPDSGRCR